MDDLVTVREAAQLLGVGISSVKRWADSGLLRCERTPGHHRRFHRSEIEELLRKRRGDYDGAPPADHPLVDLLLADSAPSELDRAVLAEHARAGRWGLAADALAPALAEIGERWSRGAITVLQEHVASERLARALARAAETLPWLPGARVALLLTAEGDEHTLGLSLAELVLREAGWKVQWGGRRTPVAEVRVFLERRPLDLVAVSASVVSGDAAQLSRQADALARVCRPGGVTLIFGGQGAWPDPVPSGLRMHGFEELARHLAREETR